MRESAAGARDAETETDFDTRIPEYDAALFAPAAEWIRQLAGKESTLVDVGCGSGNVLAHLRQARARTEVLELRSVPAYLSSLQRAAFIRRRENTTLVIRRRDAACASSS